MGTKKKKAPRILHHITIDKVGYGGIGIARSADGKKILVHGGVLPGSIVDVIVTKWKKDFFEGRVFFVHSIPQEWSSIPAICPHYFVHNGEDSESPTRGCGGCKWQQVPYEKQLALKMSIVLDSFRGCKDIIEHAEIRDILPSPTQRGYRNKIEYSFGDRKKQDVHNTRALGFHMQGQFSQIVDIQECFLVSPTARMLFSRIKKLCHESSLPVYNQVRHHGFFRHVVIREGYNTGQFLVNLSISDNSLQPEQHSIREQLQQIFHEDDILQKYVTTFLISHNNGQGDAVYTKETVQRPLWGEGHIFETLTIQDNTSTYKISANSFFQTNTHGATLLFSTAMSLLDDVRGPLIDLYCGAGSIGIAFAKGGIGDSLYGIEIVPDAIIDARYNAHINGLSHYEFVGGKVEDLIRIEQGCIDALAQTQCIIIDPPRDGLHKNVIQFLCEQKKQHTFKLLYISCNPVTLARDISLLAEAFTPRIIQPVDMFPHTHHIENICILS